MDGSTPILAGNMAKISTSDSKAPSVGGPRLRLSDNFNTMLSCLRGPLFSRSYIAVNFFNRGPLKCSCRNFIKRNAKKDGGISPAPKINTQTTNQESIFYTILKCSAFTIGVCGVVFTGAAILNYEHIKNVENSVLKGWLKENWNTLDGYEHKEGDFRKAMNKWWNALPEGRRMFWGICAANVLVFLCWRFPPFQSAMLKYFCLSPTSKVIYLPMLLSTFSHHSPFHLFINMYVLHSFSSVIGEAFGREQFLAFYLAGAIISNLGSNIFKLLMGITGPSLGASGAIMAMLGYFCTKYPDAKLGIIFLPNFLFSADSALKGVILLDLSGLIFRWGLFDHAAHLGGAVFGILYALYGQKLFWNNRTVVIKHWHDLKERYIKKGPEK